MTQWHMKSTRQPSGGRNYAVNRCDKKLAWAGGDFAETTIDAKTERRVTRTKGGGTKVKARKTNEIIVLDPKTRKMAKGELLTVVVNPANRTYARQNYMTKGAIVKIKLHGGEHTAKVTSRPGQSGVVQGILVEAPKTLEKAEKKKKHHKKAAKKEKTDEKD